MLSVDGTMHVLIDPIAMRSTHPALHIMPVAASSVGIGENRGSPYDDIGFLHNSLA